MFSSIHRFARNKGDLPSKLVTPPQYVRVRTCSYKSWYEIFITTLGGYTVAERLVLILPDFKRSGESQLLGFRGGMKGGVMPPCDGRARAGATQYFVSELSSETKY